MCGIAAISAYRPGANELSTIRDAMRARRPDDDDIWFSAPQLLPAEILARPKSGFVAPVRDWQSRKSGTTGKRGLRNWARQVYEAAA
ncbi:MAG: hypothetical protein AB7M05_12970 [Alphaproteobacteria bacterium]